MRYSHFVHNYVLNPRHTLSVAVIGAGGTGSQVLTSLGRMNYALKQLGHPGMQVEVYDEDIVTQANCGRQLFAPQEIGMNKATVLVTKLNMYFGTSWVSTPEMYDEKSEKHNITISCVDTVRSRLAIEKNLSHASGVRFDDMKKPMYWLDFGNTINSGQVVLGSLYDISQPKGKRSCIGKLPTVTELFDLNKVNEKKSGPSCSLAEALSKQDLFINSTLSNVGMALLWKMFTKGVLDVHGVFLNLESMKLNPIRVEKHG